ncbi:MAG: PAS-domain containing protein [Hyphomicrobium sp.]|jgi:GGDEF domain-containing protein
MSQTLTSLLTTRSKLSTEVQNLQVYLGVALDNMPHGLSMYDGRQRLIVANKAYRALYGLPDSLTRPGTSLAHVIRHYVKTATGQDDQDAVARQLEWVRKEVAALSNGKLQLRTQTLHGGARVRVSTQPLPNGGWVDVHEDVTDQDAREDELTRLARRDEQTDLLNRRGLGELLSQMFKEPSPFGLVLHVVHFGNAPTILQAYGFATREALIRELAVVVRGLAAPTEAARIAGDYFAIVRKCQNEQDAMAFSAELESKLPKSMTIFGQQIGLEFSLLRAHLESENVDLDQLIDRVMRDAG